jgi:hypothetical protein
VRYPLGGHSWHHLQYLIGLSRLGHEVVFFEHYGWPNSCYDPANNVMSADSSYGIRYLQNVLRHYGFDGDWCYLAEDGTAYGISRDRLAKFCNECDIYLNLSNINCIPELENCTRRVLVDTDPVFTQIGAQGAGGPFERYDVLFTYGENVHQPTCEMPTGGARWYPTRQPIVLDLWPVHAGNPSGPFTTVGSWSPIGDRTYNGRIYGMKNRQFEPFFSLPKETGERMELAFNAPGHIRRQLSEGGWNVVDARQATLDPSAYQRYLTGSRAEFAVAKHGYVLTRCGWFSERSAAYLASGRPVLVEETGFSEWLDTRSGGVIPFTTREDVLNGIAEIKNRYEFHCRTARNIAEEYFDARQVLSQLIDRATAPQPSVERSVDR